MTLSDGDLPPVVAHRRELGLDAPTHHNIQSRPWEHPVDGYDRWLEMLAEDARILTAEAAVAVARYEAARRQRPDEPSPRAALDGRLHDTGDAGVREEWRSPSGRRSA